MPGGSPMGEVVAHERDITGGELRANDAYDLTLLRQPSGNFTLLLSMKLQFFFEAKGLAKWTGTEKLQFIAEWERVVRNTWHGLMLKVLPDGKMVQLHVSFEKQIEGVMLDHWEITVRKVPAGSAFRSYVNTNTGNVALTVNDNDVVVRSVHGSGSYRQVTSVHEFAHMLGLDDEYGPLFGGDANPHQNDYDSLTNIGSTVRNRHKNSLLLWLDKALAKVQKTQKQ